MVPSLEPISTMNGSSPASSVSSSRRAKASKWSCITAEVAERYG
ncbi:hypothetical protein ABMX48_04095 [Streptomyces cavourensis]